jgi:ABC-type tungstate transport system permease subunit
VHIADDPTSCVAVGTGKALELGFSALSDDTVVMRPLINER